MNISAVNLQRRGGGVGVGLRTVSLYLAVGVSLSHLESWQLLRQAGQAGLEVSGRRQSDGWEGPTQKVLLEGQLIRWVWGRGYRGQRWTCPEIRRPQPRPSCPNLARHLQPDLYYRYPSL